MESRITQADREEAQYYIRDAFMNAGQDSYALPPTQNPDSFELLTNVMPVSKGTLERRWGYNLFTNLGSATPYRRITPYFNEAGGYRRLIFTDTIHVTSWNEDGTTPVGLFDPTGGANNVGVISSRDYAYFFDGISADLKKWDGATGVTTWGIHAPATAVNLGVPSAGNITLVKGRKYYLIFKNSTSGHLSDLNPVSASTGPITAKQIPLSSLEVSADTQVDKKIILATADGGDETTLYFVAELTNATVIYTDNTPELTLLAGNIYQQTASNGAEVGVANNAPPPNGTFAVKHNGRLIMALGQFLYFSKSIDEIVTETGVICGRYEECWPATNFLDLSENAEKVRGLLSDGNTLYMGTERHIRRMDGDNVFNFSKPEIVFNEVGILNQEVWKMCYIEGQPLGAMWITPDYRIIKSDFTTYKDIGTPVQNVLNNINVNQAASKASAIYVGSNVYDLFVLAIPTGSNTECDTLLVYNIRSDQWVVWQLTDTVTALQYNVNQSGIPQFIFAAGTGYSYLFSSTALQDRVNNTPVNFTSTVQTAWMNFGDASGRKLLNELEIGTSDSNLLVSIFSANNHSDFSTPTTIISNSGLVLSPVFNEYKIYLAGKVSNGRWYKLKFVSSAASTTSFLDYVQMELVPFNKE